MRSPTLLPVRTLPQLLLGMSLPPPSSLNSPQFTATDTDIFLHAASNSTSRRSTPPSLSRSKPGTCTTPPAKSQCTMPASQAGGNGQSKFSCKQHSNSSQSSKPRMSPWQRLHPTFRASSPQASAAPLSSTASVRLLSSIRVPPSATISSRSRRVSGKRMS